MATEQTLNDLKANCIHIWRIDLDETIDAMSGLLSREELNKAEAKKDSKERSRYIRARGCMRAILGNYLGLPGNELIFSLGDKGKPAITLHRPEIQFNLTHCEGVALLAVAKSTPVGIDLERIRSRPSLLKIARRTFSDRVNRELEQLSSDQIDSAFFRHWTELEARAKCVGEGIFSTANGEDGITSEHFYPQDDWIACVAVSGEDISSMQLIHSVFSK